MVRKVRKWIIRCLFCDGWLTGKFTKHQSGQMARWYWYCKKCKCSIMKSIKKGDV